MALKFNYLSIASTKINEGLDSYWSTLFVCQKIRLETEIRELFKSILVILLFSKSVQFIKNTNEMLFKSTNVYCNGYFLRSIPQVEYE